MEGPAKTQKLGCCQGIYFQLPITYYMSYSLNSLKGGYIGDYIGDYYKGYEGGY